MATQVKYKGSTIANFTNTTKTLKTAGKYMEGDVAVTESISLQNKSVNPTEASQTITKDSGYEGLGTVTVGAISNTYVGTSVPRRTATDLTAVASTVTVPSGYYSSQVATNVPSATHTNPTATIASATGIVTATHTQPAGYVANGTTTGTLELATQAAATITPIESVKTAVSAYRWTTGEVKVAAISSTYVGTGVTRQAATTITPTETQQTAVNASVYTTGAITVKAISSTYVGTGIPLQSSSTYNVSTADRLIASGTYLTGSQTIKSVTTTNIAAANIVKDVVVKVGDANNASRILQVTGTYSGIIPTGTYTITAAGSQHNVAAYQYASVAAGTATAPTIEIDVNPSITISNTTGIVTVSGEVTSTITPTISSGYITAGTSGVVEAVAGKTLQLTSQAAATITPTESIQTAVASYRWTTGEVKVGAISNKYVGSAVPTQAATTYNTSTADRTIAAGTYLTGAQTIKSVTTANISPENIKKGVTVTVGDANSSGRIKNVTGTYDNVTTYTATISGSGNASYCYVQYNGTKYYTDGNTFTFIPGNTVVIYSRGNDIVINGKSVTPTSYSYTYTLEPGDTTITLGYVNQTVNGVSVSGYTIPTGTYTITAALSNHNVYGYQYASVAAGGVNNPTATKGTVANNQVTVTPAVTYTAGYIAAGNKNGTGVTVSASELVGGTSTLTGAASNHNVTNYQYASVRAGAVNTPATTITKNPGVTISNTTGLVTATYTGTSDVKPNVGTSGWISAGNATAGTITTSGTGTLQLAVKAAATITPTETAQTIASNQWLTGTQTIAAISNTYVGTSVARQSASTYDVSTADRTIAAGTYLTGAQTIKGVTGKYTVTSGGTFDVKTYSQVGVAELTLPSTTLSQAPSGYTQRADFGRSTADRYVAIGTGFNSNFYYYKIDAVATAEHPNPTVAIVSSTGVVTAAHAQGTGYVTGGTTTGTLNLATKAAATITPGTTDQTIASNQWLTGVQTIKGDANLVAGNIINGKTIFGVSGNYSGIIPTGTISITAAGNTDVTAYATASVRTGAVNTPATTITATPGMTFEASTGKVTATNAKTQNVTPNVGTSGWISTGTSGTITVDGTNTYTLTPKSAADLTVAAQSVTVASGYYSSALTKAVTTTTHPNPTAAIASATGVVTATHVQTAGYVAAGTTTGTLNLTTQAATTYNTSTADQTIASNRWLTGTQTIKSVTTANLTAANIVKDVVVKVGDANNASRITQVTGTYSGIIPTGTVTLTGVNSQHNVAAYQYASVKAGSATTPATTITTNPTMTFEASTGKVTATYTGTSNITPTVGTSGWISGGNATAGTVTTTGTNTYTLTPKSAANLTFTNSTATFTTASGYYSQDTTKQITSLAAQVYYTSTADQTIASYKWLTGNQTIKSVTTANIEAANIKRGVTVQVGDAFNAGRIVNITGTYDNETKYQALLNGTGNSSYCYVSYNGTKYYQAGDVGAFNFIPGETLAITGAKYILNGESITTTIKSYTLPPCDIDITFNYTNSTLNIVTISAPYVAPTGTYTITGASSQHNVYNYQYASVATGAVNTPATTIDLEDVTGVTISSTTGKITVDGTASVYVTPNVTTSGWVSSGNVTSGKITADVVGSLQLTTQAAQTLNTSTADRTIASYRWLTGTQTIKSVTTTNITAANIASGVTVKVGDANNASRILQVTGTYTGGAISLSTGNSMWSSTFATGTTVLTLGSFTLPKGQWQVDATVRWNSNSSGRRYMLVSTASTATSAIYEDTAAPVNGGVTHCRTNFAVDNTAQKTWYVRGFQNGGASLAAYVRIYYIGTPG